MSVCPLHSIVHVPAMSDGFLSVGPLAVALTAAVKFRLPSLVAFHFFRPCLSPLRLLGSAFQSDARHADAFASLTRVAPSRHVTLLPGEIAESRGRRAGCPLVIDQRASGEAEPPESSFRSVHMLGGVQQRDLVDAQYPAS